MSFGLMDREAEGGLGCLLSILVADVSIQLEINPRATPATTGTDSQIKLWGRAEWVRCFSHELRSGEWGLRGPR